MSFKKLIFVLLIAVSVVVMMTGVTSANPPQQTDRPQFVPGEVLLKLKEGISSDRINEVNQQFNTQTIRFFRNSQIFHIKLPENLPVDKAIEKIQKHPLVEYVARNGLYYLDVIPNDPQTSQLWGLHNVGQNGGTPDADIDAVEAWDITTGSNDVVIAVIDSGLDLDHEDLAANIWTNPGEIPDNGVDDDGNGFIDDVHGWDFSSNDNDPSPAGRACAGHGDHTAGTIGAVGNNGAGVVGVNWNVKIMPLKAFNVSLLVLCSANEADLIAAIEYHTMMGVRISSNSWGGSNFSAATRDAIRASNSVFVAAAGNGGLDGVGDNNDTKPNYPSNYDLSNIIAVAATDRNDNKAGFSNFGLTTVDLGAPGVDIFSTLSNNQYGNLSGTSMATPHVAGVAGLLLAQDPNLTVNEIKWRILHGTDDIGLPVLTGGRLNANKALQFGLSVPVVTVEITPVGPTEVSPGDMISAQFNLTNHGTSSISGTFKAYARLNNGREASRNPVTVTLNPGQTIIINQSAKVPPQTPPGTAFWAFGQIETAVSFDEDRVEYTVRSASPSIATSHKVYLPFIQVGEGDAALSSDRRQ